MATLSVPISFTYSHFIRRAIFIFVMLLLPVAQAKSGFLAGVATGATVGYLFGSVDHQKIINNNQLEIPYEDRLYEEYKRNEAMIQSAGVNREVLLFRNQQIAREFIKRAQDSYIRTFSLKLTPIANELVEQQSAVNKSLFNKVGAKSFGTHRDRIRYSINFDEDSPQSIADFDVLAANGQPVEKSGDAWFYTYTEQWGTNTVAVELQNRKYPELRFTLKKFWDVPTAEEVQRAENNTVNQSNLEYYGVIFGLSILFWFFVYPAWVVFYRD